MAESEQDFSGYFGHPDAAKEGPTSIVPDHVIREFEKTIKAGNRAQGKQVIFGLKGSGKTAVRRYLEQRDGIPTWNLDSDHPHLTMDANAAQGSSGFLKNGIAFRLLSSFGSYLQANPQEFGLPPREATIGDALSAAADGLKTVLGAVDLKLPFVQINFSKLVKSETAPIVIKATNELIRALLKALGKRRVYLMIDDADDIFEGLDRSPAFIEGLVLAVASVNELAGDHLHVLLFLKYGVWRAWFERPKEYDRVAHLLQEVAWNDRSLVDLLARRIARIHQIKVPNGEIPNPEMLWAEEFDWSGDPSFESFTARFTQLCVSGPRDIIALANDAKDAAGNAKITTAHLAKVIPRYSEAKLYGINADFGSIYPDVSQFVQMVFQGCPREMPGPAVAQWIEQHGLTSARVDNHFKAFSWYATAAKERLLEIMFRVGLFGRRLQDGSVEYAIHRSQMPADELLASTLVVHPALQRHLSVTAPAAAPAKGRRRSS